MASDIFAKIGDIKGESLDDQHKDEIEVLSYSWGMTNIGSVVPGVGDRPVPGMGKARFQDLSIVHNVDKASPLLMQACATGARLQEATITLRKPLDAGSKDPAAAQQEFLVIKMNEVIITSVTQAGATDQPVPETVSLAFLKIDVEYKPQAPDAVPDAGIHFNYNLVANKIG